MSYRNPCGRPAECADCSEVKPIRGNGMCSRCYQRHWNRQRRHVQKQPRSEPQGQHKLYEQAIVRVPVKGWGYLPYWEVPF